MTDTDVFISGGGLAGLAAAAAFDAAGFSVVLVDPAPPTQTAEDDQSDLRSTAYLQASKTLFERIGLWDVLECQATALSALRIVDTVGDPPVIQTDRMFQSSDISDTPFGWNVPNWLARKTLTDHLAQRIDLRLGTGFSSILTRDKEALVTLSTSERLRAKLAVAADGHASPLRQAVGIDTITTRYAQKALAFAVTHDTAHNGVSTEIYASGGAFTLVPLQNQGQTPASAVVWMEDGPNAQHLAQLSPTALSAAATGRSAGVLGDLSVATAVRSWPVVLQEARRLTARRTALIAEAAHVMPPIGAQGLNTSLLDVAALFDAACQTPDDLGGPSMLKAYHTARARDLKSRTRAIDLFNRICRTGHPGLRAFRSAGLNAIHDIAPLRMALMKRGLST